MKIVAFDGQKNTVLARWPLAPCKEPSALAFDANHRRLFAGCDNKMMAVVNADTGKVVTTVPIGEGVDAGAFNAQTQEVFMSTGDGHLTVIHEDTPDTYTVRQTLDTQRGARTMALDPTSGTIYLVTADREATSPPPGQRPAMVPGSFTLLVVEAAISSDKRHPTTERARFRSCPLSIFWRWAAEGCSVEGTSMPRCSGQPNRPPDKSALQPWSPSGLRRGLLRHPVWSHLPSQGPPRSK